MGIFFEKFPKHFSSDLYLMVEWVRGDCFENKLLLQPDVVFDSESNGRYFSSLAPPGYIILITFTENLYSCLIPVDWEKNKDFQKIGKIMVCSGKITYKWFSNSSQMNSYYKLRFIRSKHSTFVGLLCQLVLCLLVLWDWCYDNRCYCCGIRVNVNLLFVPNRLKHSKIIELLYVLLIEINLKIFI